MYEMCTYCCFSWARKEYAVLMACRYGESVYESKYGKLCEFLVLAWEMRKALILS